MPTYEYECLDCGHRFEQFQSITDKPLSRCPSCGKRVRRHIGAGAGILFKGSGFYTTDYRSSSYRQAARKDQSSAPSSSASGAAGSPKKDP